MKPFCEHLTRLNKPNLGIFVSPLQRQFANIQGYIKQYPQFTLLARIDVSDPLECPAFPPSQAKRLGIYDTLPVKTLKP
jgi:hypothetical protein